MVSKIVITVLVIVGFVLVLQLITVRKEVINLRKDLKIEQQYSDELEKAMTGIEVFPVKTKSWNLMKKNEENVKKS